MIHHYMTKYAEGGTLWAESWIQLNLFGRCYCFSRRKVALRESMDDEHKCVTIKATCLGVDAAQAQVDKLAEKVAEAKTLANELASALDELRFTFSMDDGTGK